MINKNRDTCQISVGYDEFNGFETSRDLAVGRVLPIIE